MSYLRIILLSAGVLSGCASDGHITQIFPTGLFRKHSAGSPFPDINTVPVQVDPRLKKLSLPDTGVGELRSDLQIRRQNLELYNPPEKRDYNDPEWRTDTDE